jgi:hypothetical protein
MKFAGWQEYDSNEAFAAIGQICAKLYVSALQSRRIAIPVPAQPSL